MCVDLDGTLIASDTLMESLLLSLKAKPFIIFLLPIWFLKGRANLKSRLASIAMPDALYLPYRADFLDFLKDEKSKGRRIILTTATNEKIAQKVAEHIQIFDEVIASSDLKNIRSSHKKDELVSRFGEKGFDYAGDLSADLPVWNSANYGIAINPSAMLKRKLKKLNNISKVFEYPNNRLLLFIKGIRVHQWLKNLLLFLPLIMAHRLTESDLLLRVLIGFISFCLAASFVYLINDLTDIEPDRHHPRKKNRPVASGVFPIYLAIIVSVLFLTAGLLLSFFFLPAEFIYILFTYLILTLTYSFYLKSIYIIDIIILSLLYTLRLLAGATAVNVPASKWLLAFSVFMFLSLAILKRYTELRNLKMENKSQAKGRGYEVNDLGLLMNFGQASGYLSVLVFALYIYSNEILHLYKKPEFLWPVAVCILFWITRIWFLAHRDKMHDDPIVFTAKDPVSYIVGIIITLLVIGAAI